MKILLLNKEKKRLVFRILSIVNTLLSTYYITLQYDKPIHYDMIQYWSIFSIAILLISILIPLYKVFGILIIDDFRLELKTAVLNRTVLIKDINKIDIVYRGFNGEKIYSLDYLFFPSVSENNGVGEILIDTNIDKYSFYFRASKNTLRQLKSISQIVEVNIKYDKEII